MYLKIKIKVEIKINNSIKIKSNGAIYTVNKPNRYIKFFKYKTDLIKLYAGIAFK
jgi:hypothetical protein